MKQLQKLKNMLSSKSKNGSKSGFTLIELIVVIAIIGILAAITLPRLSGYTEDAQNAKAQASAQSVYTAAAAYVANNATFAAGTSTTPIDFNSNAAAAAALKNSFSGTTTLVAIGSVDQDGEVAVSVVPSTGIYTVQVFNPTEANKFSTFTY